MLPQRSNRCRPTASNRRRLVTGEVHSRCSCASRGNRRSRPASGARVALMLLGQLHHLSNLYVPAILLRRLACHVTRRLLFIWYPLFEPGVLGSGSYSHFVGSYSFLFLKMATSFSVSL